MQHLNMQAYGVIEKCMFCLKKWLLFKNVAVHSLTQTHFSKKLR